MAKVKSKENQLPNLYTGVIFDKKGETFFTVSTPVITIGKSLPGAPDHQIRVGDTVYLSLQFSAASLPLNVAIDALNFEDFFKFRSESDSSNLIVKFLDKDTRANPLINLEYLVDMSNLNSGEKIINLIGYTLIAAQGVALQLASTLEEANLSRSDPFYLHQSILNKFQDNIANGGIADRATGLARENIDFPSYLPVGLQPVNPFVTKDVALWEVIRDGTNALSFRNYSRFMDFIFCGGINPFESLAVGEVYKDKLASTNKNLSLPFNNVDTYRAIKVATEAFVIATINVAGELSGDLKNAYNNYLEAVNKKANSGATIKILPYLALIREKLPDIDIKSHTFDEALSHSIHDQTLLDACYGLLKSKLQFPCFLELIWSYWHEESMMVQGINTIARRFQNIRGEGLVDPMANLEIGPLRPLNNLMWGYIQDEQHRLTVRRRAYEYDHHYGITLQGTALRGMRMADSRSKFIEAFHTLLNLCIKFYHQYDDTTVVADGFPIMNALKEVHMILSEGAHNQFGDLPSTARIEMLMQLYILARPEFREFLPTRQMVAYPEAWMDRVGVLNQMHNWTKTNVLHYRDLAVFGEQIVLSIRFGAWSDVINRDQAANWAIFWRPQIQNYMHAYRAVSGVDLTREDGVIDVQQPSVHLLRRLKEENIKVRI